MGVFGNGAWEGGRTLGLSRFCSATFEQLLAFGATFCGSSNLEQTCLSEQLLSKI